MTTPSLPHTIDRFVQAVNHHNRQTLLAFFPEGGIVIDSGRRFVGHDAIQRWSDHEFIGAHGRMTVKEVTQKKDYRLDLWCVGGMGYQNVGKLDCRITF